jgi:virginiamycin B lyase
MEEVAMFGPNAGTRRLTTLAMAVLLAGAACGGEAPSPQTTAKGSPQPQVSLPAGVPQGAAVEDLDGRLQAELSIAGEPDWMAEGFGSVWVSRTDPEGEGNHLDRIDPATNEIVASIEVGRHPCHGVAVGFGSVWVPMCIDQRIVRIDPGTNEVVASFDIPLHRADGDRLAADFGALWIISPDPKGGDVLARIDPQTGQVGSIPLPTPSTEITVGFGSLWVMSPDGGVVHQIDPESQELVGTIQGLTEPKVAAAGEDALWVADAGDGTVARIDPASLEILEKIEIGTPGFGGGVAADETGVWFRPANYLLGRIDPSAGQVVEVFTEPPALGDVLVAFDSVWFSSYTKDTVWRVST